MRTLHTPSEARRRLVLALAAVLLLAACGGDDAAEEADADEPEPAADEPEDEAASEPDEPEDDPADDGDGEDGDFEELLAAGSDVALAITYEGEDDTGEPFEMRLAQDPPAVALLFSYADDEARLLQPSDGSFVTCFREDGQWECLRLAGFEDALEHGLAGSAVPFVFDLDELAAAAPGWVDVTSGNVAGRSARCASSPFAYGPDGDEVEGRSEVCVDEETGAMLSFLSESSDGLHARLEATDVGDPDPSWFEPPVEPVDLEEMFGDFGDFDPEDFDFDPEDFDPEDFDPEDFGG